LVATTFLGEHKLLQVNHLDGNKLNNSVDNLEWCTHFENMQHAHSTGLIPSRRGLEPEQVREVRAMLAEGIKQTIISKTLGIEASLISKIKTGFIYKDVA